MGKNREQKKEKKWNKKSSEKEVLNSKYIRSKVKLMEKRQKQQTEVKRSKNRRQTS